MDTDPPLLLLDVDGVLNALGRSLPPEWDDRQTGGLTGRWWRFDVVRRLVRAQPRRRLVWLDDDLAGEDDLRAWAAQEADCLPVAPPPRSGLRPMDREVVSAWLDAG